MPDENAPAYCPRCTGTRVSRVLWGWGFLSAQDKADALAGRMILGSRHRFGVPNHLPSPGRLKISHPPLWACLDCEPRWAEVHELALEEESLLEPKEKAVERQDFEAAAAYYEKQHEIS